MPVVQRLGNKAFVHYGELAFWCLGCESLHTFNTEDKSHWKDPNQKAPKWTFSGNFELPTFNPSLVVRTKRRRIDNGQDVWFDWKCHLYVKNGEILYLSDCSHKLAGQKVKMLQVKDWP